VAQGSSSGQRKLEDGDATEADRGRHGRYTSAVFSRGQSFIECSVAFDL
jgi:hypothetical protein